MHENIYIVCTQKTEYWSKAHDYNTEKRQINCSPHFVKVFIL